MPIADRFLLAFFLFWIPSVGCDTAMSGTEASNGSECSFGLVQHRNNRIVVKQYRLDLNLVCASTFPIQPLKFSRVFVLYCIFLWFTAIVCPAGVVTWFGGGATIVKTTVFGALVVQSRFRCDQCSNPAEIKHLSSKARIKPIQGLECCSVHLFVCLSTAARTRVGNKEPHQPYFKMRSC